MREPATTDAPSSANALVTARPMPRLAPVTTATRPDKCRSMPVSSTTTSKIDKAKVSIPSIIREVGEAKKTIESLADSVVFTECG
nr:hypothetical protein GCM10017745_63370 [Saccharothrix mutabilis subsp. capreolus]